MENDDFQELGANFIIKKTKAITVLLILSLSINICCGIYIFPKIWTRVNRTLTTENDKYDAKLSTFKLNSNETDIIFLGDSITAYINWNGFFPSLNLLNRGIEEDTWGVFCRLEEVTERKPKTIILMVGINDIAAGSSSSEIIETAGKVIERIENELPNTRIILCDTLPSPLYSLSVIEEVTRGYASLSEIHANITYLPLMELYRNSDGTENGELFSNDNVHLNGNGYSVWLNELRNVLLE